MSISIMETFLNNLNFVNRIGRMKRKACRWRMPVGAAGAVASVVESVGWGEVRSASGSGVGDPARPAPINDQQHFSADDNGSI